MINDYPCRRVIICFTLCPLLCGFIYGLFGVGAIFLNDNDYSFSTGIGMFFILPVAGGLTGLFYFGIPAFILSITYVLFHLEKNWFGYLFVTLFGGVVAQSSSSYILGISSSNNILLSPFLLGAISSLLMAYFVLPKRD